jgi:hypothetical protein
LQEPISQAFRFALLEGVQGSVTDEQLAACYEAANNVAFTRARLKDSGAYYFLRSLRSSLYRTTKAIEADIFVMDFNMELSAIVGACRNTTHATRTRQYLATLNKLLDEADRDSKRRGKVSLVVPCFTALCNKKRVFVPALRNVVDEHALYVAHQPLYFATGTRCLHKVLTAPYAPNPQLAADVAGREIDALHKARETLCAFQVSACCNAASDSAADDGCC